jgi:hypothetical protein
MSSGFSNVFWPRHEGDKPGLRAYFRTSLARFYASFIILASDASMSLGSDNITKSMRRGRVAEYALVAAGFATAIIFIINNL